MTVSLSVIKNTILTGSLTVLSRCFGLARDVTLALTFGVGLDAFLVAFRVPNLFRRLFAEGSMAQAVTPVLSEYRETRGAEAERALLSQVGAWLLGATAGVTILGVVMASALVFLIAPGFTGDDRSREASDMLSICFLYLPLVSLTALAGAALNVHRHFAMPAFAPVLLNVCLIAAALWLSPLLSSPLHALAIAVPVAGVAQLVIMLPGLRRRGLLVAPRWRADPEGGKRVFKLMLPTVLVVSVSQINLLLDTFIASFLREGSLSWLYYADRVMEFPLGVFGVALATVLLPSLSAYHAKGRTAEGSLLLDLSLRWCVLVGAPAAVGLFVLAWPSMVSLFTYGAFSPDSAEQAAWALRAYAVGVPALILVKVLAVGHFARLDARSPARVALVCVGVNLLLNLVFVWSLAHVGLALATSLAAWTQAWLLFRAVKRHGYSSVAGWPALAARVAVACAVMAAAVLFMTPERMDWLAGGALSRVGWLVALVAGGFCAYVLSLSILGWRPRHVLEAGGRAIPDLLRRRSAGD